MDDFFNNILRGLGTYRFGIFLVLGLGIVIYIRRFLIGLQEWQKSVFGLERSIAQRKLVGATSGLTLMILMIIGEFLIVTIVTPRLTVDGSAGVPVVEPLQTPTALAAGENTPEAVPTATVGQESLVSECTEGVVEITSPANGEIVSGTVELIGSVNIENFGSYKYEFSPTGSVSWTTIAANNTLKLDENLGYWYTSNLTPGIYLLQLVPLDNTGVARAPCIISVEVVPEE